MRTGLPEALAEPDIWSTRCALTTWEVGSWHPHRTDEEAVAQSGSMTCPGDRTGKRNEIGADPRGALNCQGTTFTITVLSCILLQLSPPHAPALHSTQPLTRPSPALCSAPHMPQPCTPPPSGDLSTTHARSEEAWVLRDDGIFEVPACLSQSFLVTLRVLVGLRPTL